MSYELIISPYYNHYLKHYENILLLSNSPPGPLKDHIKHINIDNLSAFKSNKERNCVYAITDFDNHDSLLTLDNISQLISFFISHNYSIDHKLTKLLKPEVDYNLLFLFSYN